MDIAHVDALANRLYYEHNLAIFYDAWHLAKGHDAHMIYERTLKECVACLVCIGADERAWQDDYLWDIIMRPNAPFKLIFILLPGAKDFNNFNCIDFRDGQPRPEDYDYLIKEIFKGEDVLKPVQDFRDKELNDKHPLHLFTRNQTIQDFPYKTLTNLIELKKEYQDLMFLAITKIRLREYEEAMALCDQAISLSAREPYAWEYKGICMYFMKSRDELINERAKSLIDCMDVSNESEMHSKTYSGITLRLAMDLYYSIWNRYEKIKDEKSTDEHRHKVINYLMSWYACYQLYKHPYFLHKIIEELSVFRKWIVERSAGGYKNVYEGFDAVKYRNRFINEIRAYDPAYMPPTLANEIEIAKLEKEKLEEQAKAFKKNVFNYFWRVVVLNYVFVFLTIYPFYLLLKYYWRWVLAVLVIAALTFFIYLFRRVFKRLGPKALGGG